MRPIDPLLIPIQYVKGVGPARAKAFRRLQVETVRDALFFLPRRYEDRSELCPIAQLDIGTRATFRARIHATNLRNTRRGYRLFEVFFRDQTGLIKAIWFNFNLDYMTTHFTRGKEVVVSGDIRANFYTGQPEVLHPDVEFVEGEASESVHMGRIIPIYPATEGMPQKQLRRIMKQ
ncbi:MAG: DNA helicase RecG, partial [Nitrospinota bacterium]